MILEFIYLLKLSLCSFRCCYILIVVRLRFSQESEIPGCALWTPYTAHGRVKLANVNARTSCHLELAPGCTEQSYFMGRIKALASDWSK